jgi:hypothetical protein
MKTVPVWISDDNDRLRLGKINELLAPELTRHRELRGKTARTTEENAEMREINLRVNALERIWSYVLPVAPGLPLNSKRSYSDREKQILEQQFSTLMRNRELREVKRTGVLQPGEEAELEKIQDAIARIDKEYEDLQKLI